MEQILRHVLTEAWTKILGLCPEQSKSTASMWP